MSFWVFIYLILAQKTSILLPIDVLNSSRNYQSDIFCGGSMKRLLPYHLSGCHSGIQKCYPALLVEPSLREVQLQTH